MMENLNHEDMKRKQMIEDIIRREWDMFQDVDNIGGRASCQDDWETFYIMRYSQAAMMDDGTLAHYQQDLENAAEEGRNLITEKYGYMMEFTEPEYYQQRLKERLPAVSPSKAALIEKISAVMLESEKAFAKKHPRFAQNGRPLTSTETDMTPFYAYLVGELKTYSEATLESLLLQVTSMEAQGKSTAETIHQTVVNFYGYENVEQAEAAMERSTL